MKNVTKLIAGLFLTAFGSVAFAQVEVTYPDGPEGESACITAMNNGTAVHYEPVAPSIHREVMVRKFPKLLADADGCHNIAVNGGKAWVFQKVGTEVLATRIPNGSNMVVGIFRCGNRVFKSVYRQENATAQRSVPPMASQTPVVHTAAINLPKAGMLEFPSWVPKDMVSGTIYMNPNGDTFQNVIFTRLCINALKGNIVDWRGSVAGTPEEALKQCLAWQAGETYLHTLPDTSAPRPATPVPQSAPQSQAPQAQIAQAPQAQAPQQPAPQPQAGGNSGGHTCNGRLASGQIVEANGVDQADCHKNLNAKVLKIDPTARQQGGIVQGPRPQT